MTELYDFLLPVLLPILVALLLVALLVGIGAVPNAYFRVAMSGWPRLAKEYAYTGPPLPAHVCWLTPLLGAWLNTVPLRIGAHETGLYLCPVGPARFFARPVLIPWSRVGLPEGYGGGDSAARAWIQLAKKPK